MRHRVALCAGNAADPAGDLTAKSEKALSGSGRAFFITASDIVAVFANKADAKTLNRATGIVLVVLGIVVMGFNLLTK